MERTKQNPIRTKMILEISSINSALKNDPRLPYLSNMLLLRNTHPIYRKGYAKELWDAGMISEKQFKQITSPTFNIVPLEISKSY